ncbi:Proline-specific permease [Colletotrichum fructicola]|uniref:Proline permease n=1 Tax=Colletotrichum fructicola (strain Nara gc5) TaxID=1213859 RepID=L2G1J2_COLFN|nr:Proline-specific permease [Colletotrichum fructicola]KAF4477059.1 Proline-specific permease [Colletotrichum fructicola Nara gc5]KAE9573869.1 Proline-specific permease [Colletotrichum fructicola]KAF4419279.1 Proline-specific permease [Colletotrichum fructicola]KAF4889613.1 Proline-specific permease [Colletotrichum fructicola]KAF4931382.1 Proline-specific permease [Colletotrichum fructicola]
MSLPSESSDKRDVGKIDVPVDNEVTRVTSVAHGEVDEEPGRIVETQRGLKSRHAQMIALGGTIGTGLFVGSGQVLQMGGPLFLLLAYSTITILLYGVATATGEMSSYLPVPGCSVAYYGNRFVSKSLGFTLGWVYWYIFAITVPAEINVTALIIEYWNPPVHTAVWLVLVGGVIILCNCLPVRVYGETEFWFASTKVIGILGLLIMTVVLFFGGGPAEPLYFKHWRKPGPINAYLVEGPVGHLCAFISCTTFSVYAFGFAPELMVITGGEMESPRTNIPKATIRYFYRLITFYILGAFAIGILVPSTHKQLLSAGSGAAASPWAIGARDAGIRGLDSVINAMIVLSAWSAGNSYLYLASRALYSLAKAGNAPAIFARCTKSGIPYYATGFSSLFSLLAFLNISRGGSAAAVFNWFANLISTGAFQSWICCCVIYMRFRKAADHQGIANMPFRSRFQPYSSWVSACGFSILLLLNGYKVFVRGYWDISTFITSYVGILIFACLYLGHKFTVGRCDKLALSPSEVDLVSGIDEILAEVNTPVKPEKWYFKWKLLFE